MGVFGGQQANSLLDKIMKGLGVHYKTLQGKTAELVMATNSYFDATNLEKKLAKVTFNSGWKCKMLELGKEKGYVCSKGDVSKLAKGAKATTCKGLVAAPDAKGRISPIARPMAKQVGCKAANSTTACEVEKISVCAHKNCPENKDREQQELAVHF